MNIRKFRKSSESALMKNFGSVVSKRKMDEENLFREQARQLGIKGFKNKWVSNSRTLKWLGKVMG